MRASETDAIQLSRVLIGALAGLTNTPQVTMFELYERLLKSEMNGNSRSGSSISTASMNELRNEKRRIDPIAMLTLGDLWAIWQPTASSTGFMGSSGSTSTRAASSWNNPFCPFYFQLQSPFQLPQAGITGGASIGPGMVQFAGVSASELRGGLDGLAIGTALSTVRQARSTMKLSQILKMYYYGQGISSPAGDVSVCQRQDQLEFFLPNLINSAAHYLQFIDLTSSKVFTSEAYARAQLKETEHDFQSKLSDAVSLSDSNAALLNAWCAQKRSQMISSGFDIRNYGSSAGKRFDLRSRGSMDESVYNGNSFNGFGDPYAESNLPGHGKPANGNRYQPSNWDVNRAECDTPVDLLFVVDASNQVAQQLSIVNRILAVHPTMHKESISVLANRPGSGQYRNGLDVISWRERIKEKVVCDLQTALEGKNLIALLLSFVVTEY